MKLSLFTIFLGLVLGEEPAPVTPPKGEQVTNLPKLGLGTWYIKGNATEAIASAIELGYRHIDCAWIYENQAEIGPGIKEGIKRAGITRKDLWITSKLWNTKHSNAASGLKETLNQLGLDYLDLWLVHWPMGGYFGMGNDFDHVSTWKQMEKLIGKGTRYIGVANHSPSQVEDILKIATIKPKTVQIELHPYLPQTEYVESLQKRGFTVTGYSPLGNTNPVYKQYGARAQKILSHPSISEVANARGCTPAQAVLAWNIARGVVVIPKAAQRSHQKENIETVEKCKLTEGDVTKISSISKAGQHRMTGNLCGSMANGCWKGLTVGYS